MKAALLKNLETVSVEDVEVPVPAEGECLIRIELAGICGSDNSLYKGKCNVPFPVIPGHEAVGVVETTTRVNSRLHPGQRVVIHPNIACGDCPNCIKDLPNICEQKQRVGIDRNGVFAEFIAVPENYVWPIPDSLTNEVAVFTEPLAVAMHGVNFVKPAPTDKVLVFGAGVIGQLVLQLATLSTSKVIACDLSKTRLDLARKLGAEESVECEDLLQKHRGSFDIVYETSGAPAGLSQAIELVAPGGSIVLFGLPGLSHPIRSDVIVRKQIKIFGSIIYIDEFSEVISLLENNKIDTESLISDTIDLEMLGDSLKGFHQPDRMKTIVRI